MYTYLLSITPYDGSIGFRSFFANTFFFAFFDVCDDEDGRGKNLQTVNGGEGEGRFPTTTSSFMLVLKWPQTHRREKEKKAFCGAK